jgi:DNA helicase HerA-like ATPase
MIHEEVISQLHTQVFLRLTSDVDLDKIRRASEEDISQFIPEIKRLNQREALIVGDAVAFPSSIEVMWFDPSKLREEFMQEKKKMPKPEYEV